MALPDADITSFNYTVDYNLNTQIITITDDSVYLQVGNITGIVATMTAPNLVTDTVTFAANASGTMTMPTINGGVVYGFYTITAVITDSVGNNTLTKTAFNICKPKQCDTTRNSDGCLDTGISFKCFDNKVLYADTTSYVYKDEDATTITRSTTVVDPNNVTQVTSSTAPSFYISPIVNGRYSFTIINSAVYTFDQDVTVTITYQSSNQQYTAACDINLCDVQCAVDKIYDDWKLEKGSGSTQERTLKATWEQLAFLMQSTKNGIECGEDVSDKITEIEKLSKVKCSCGCGTTNPNTPVCCEQQIVMVEGAGINVEQTTSGETTTFTITNTNVIIDACKVKAHSGDTVCDYLINKIESTDASLIIAYAAAAAKVNLRVAPLVWVNLTPAGTWAIQAGSRFQYTKDAYGNVYVRGLLTRTLAAITTYNVGTLPAGYYPTVPERLVGIYSAVGVAQETIILEVSITGVISITTGAPATTCILSTNLMFNVN